MAQLLSLAAFSAILLVSIMAIVATVMAELPYIQRALGIEPSPGRSCLRQDLGLAGASQPCDALPQLRHPRDARVRVIRSGKPAAGKPRRAVA